MKTIICTFVGCLHFSHQTWSFAHLTVSCLHKCGCMHIWGCSVCANVVVCTFEVFFLHISRLHRGVINPTIQDDFKAAKVRSSEGRRAPFHRKLSYDSNSARMATSGIIANQEAEFQLLSWKLPFYKSCYHNKFLWNGVHTILSVGISFVYRLELLKVMLSFFEFVINKKRMSLLMNLRKKI